MMGISDCLEKANLAIGELNKVIENAPDPNSINYMYVRKEAVLSSQIEGRQSTLDDLLRYESGSAIGKPIDDVAEVSSYVADLNHGLEQIEGGFPLSLHLIREIHKTLLTKARGKNKTPGEFRTSQNWIGGTRPSNTRVVPAPPDKVMVIMGDLEKFIRESAGAVLDIFKQTPLLTITEITKRTGFAKTTAISAVNRLIDLGLIKNISEKRWGQIYSYATYTKLLPPPNEE